LKTHSCEVRRTCLPCDVFRCSAVHAFRSDGLLRSGAPQNGGGGPQSPAEQGIQSAARPAPGIGDSGRHAGHSGVSAPAGTPDTGVSPFQGHAGHRRCFCARRHPGHRWCFRSRRFPLWRHNYHRCTPRPAVHSRGWDQAAGTTATAESHFGSTAQPRNHLDRRAVAGKALAARRHFWLSRQDRIRRHRRAGGSAAGGSTGTTAPWRGDTSCWLSAPMRELRYLQVDGAGFWGSGSYCRAAAWAGLHRVPLEAAPTTTR